MILVTIPASDPPIADYVHRGTVHHVTPMILAMNVFLVLKNYLYETLVLTTNLIWLNMIPVDSVWTIEINALRLESVLCVSLGSS